MPQVAIAVQSRAILSAVANRRVDRAEAAVDVLIDFMDGMFEGMESGIDPALLDCSIEPLPASRNRDL